MHAPPPTDDIYDILAISEKDVTSIKEKTKGVFDTTVASFLH